MRPRGGARRHHHRNPRRLRDPHWLSGDPAGRATRCTTLPANRDATARHIAPVSGTARWGWPIEIMRTVRSAASAASDSPASVDARRCGAVDHRDFRDTRLARRFLGRLRAFPCARLAATRIASRRASSSAVRFELVGHLDAGHRRGLRRRRRRRDWPHRPSRLRYVPTPGRRAGRSPLPVGSSLPVPAPPGSRNSRRIGAPVPGHARQREITVDGGAAIVHREARDDDLPRVGVVDADDGVGAGHLDHSFVDRERPDRRGHVAAIAAVIDGGRCGPRPARRCSPRPRRRGVGGPTTQTFDSDEMPPPMPSSWRPLGSGLPIAARKMRPTASRSRGRSSARNIIALLVPPRMKTARTATCRIRQSNSRREPQPGSRAALVPAIRPKTAPDIRPDPPG